MTVHKYSCTTECFVFACLSALFRLIRVLFPGIALFDFAMGLFLLLCCYARCKYLFIRSMIFLVTSFHSLFFCFHYISTISIISFMGFMELIFLCFHSTSVRQNLVFRSISRYECNFFVMLENSDRNRIKFEVSRK